MEKTKQAGREEHRQSMLEAICEVRTGQALEEALRRDEKYQREKKEINRRIHRIQELGLTAKQWDAVDEALAACNDRGSEYGRAAYCQGFQDAVRLGVELLAKIEKIDL